MSPDDVAPRVGEFVAAWNAHDMGRLARLFSEDADFVTVAGMWWHGRDEIERNHAAAHASRFRESVLDASLAAFKEVSPTVGVAHITWRLDVGDVDRRGVFTWTLRKRDGVVEIVAAHNTDTVG